MNPKIKIIAYALLAVCTLWFGYSFFSSLSRASAPRPERVQPDDEAASTNSVTAAVTNATSATSTNAAEDTNAIAAATNAVPAQTNKIVKAQAPPPSNKVNWGSFGM